MGNNVINNCLSTTVFSGVISNAIAILDFIRTNNYLNFDGVASYGYFPEITVTPNTTIEMDIIPINATLTYKRFIGSADLSFSVDTGISGNDFRLVGCTATLDGTPIVSESTPIPNDGLLHKLVITPTVTAVVDSIAKISTNLSNYQEGVIANLKIYENGSIVRHYPIDSKGDNVQRNILSADGVEMVLNGTFDNSSNWVTTAKWVIQNGRAEFTDLTSPGENISQLGVFEIGKTYKISFDVESTGTICIEDGAGVPIVIGNTGTITTIWTADTSELSFKRIQNGTTGYIDNVTVKETTDMLLYNVDQNNDWYELQDTGKFLGDSVWKFGDAVGFTQTNSFTTIVGTGFELVLPVGQQYLLTANKQTDMRVQFRLTSSQTSIFENGDIERTLTVNSSSGEARFRSDGASYVPVSGDITNIKLRHILNP